MPPETSNSQQGAEAVHTVFAYYDGARGGIANYKGQPHIYESSFEDAPDGTDAFLIQPIDEETFRLAMEDWQIWCRWERAFHGGRTTQDTHPALPEDRGRHEVLEALLQPRLKIEEGRAVRLRGRFYVRAPAEPGLTSSAEWVVDWLSDD